MASNLQPVPLNPVLHRTHGWHRQNDFAFAARQTAVAVVLNELTALLPAYPLAFVRNSAGKYQLAALLGLYQGENLLIDDSGLWSETYVPSLFRAYPFILGQSDGDTDARKFMLCFDHGSGLYREHPNVIAADERFFDDAGELQPFMRRLMEFLTASISAQRQTQTAVDALVQANLLMPWDIAPAREPAEPQPLAGIYRINEAALNSLPGPALETLRQANALPVAYAQMFSMPRLRGLHQRHTDRVALKAKQALALKPATPISLDDLGDLLSFNWMK